MHPNLLNFDIQTFLDDNWQRQACVLRKGLRNFKAPLDADELAGLAGEAEVESRLIWKDEQGEWQAAHGPFESFDHLGERDWSLVVQAVDNWSEDAQSLFNRFNFLPNWRSDDLMVSFAAPGGGVGPHIDQYDVFIIQGTGSRRWRVGAVQELDQHIAHPSLRHCGPFEAEIDVVLAPGDILYIPPGAPHEGISETASLSFSVGFRAPDQKELAGLFADHLATLPDDAFRRYSDAGQSRVHHPGLLSGNTVAQMTQMLRDLLDQPALMQAFLAQKLSESKHELDLTVNEPAWDVPELLQAFGDGAWLQRLGGVRCLYLDSQPNLMFVNGEMHGFPEGAEAWVALLCDKPVLRTREILELLNRPGESQETALQVVCSLINQGYWYLRDE